MATAHKRKEPDTLKDELEHKARRTEEEVSLLSLKGLVGAHSFETTGAYHTNPSILAALEYVRAEQLRPPHNVVFTAERTDKVVDVFKGLIKHNFLSVPVLQKTKHKWYGFLDLADIVVYIVKTFGEEKLNLDQDFWVMCTKESEFQDKTVNDLMHYPLSRRNPFHPVKAGFSLLYAMEALAKEAQLHRVPVIDEDRQLMSLITQSQVVRFLQQNMASIGDKRLKPIHQMREVLHEVFSVTVHQKAIDAFHLMVEKGVTGVAIVDDSGKLKGNLSVRDLKAMSPDGRLFWRLFQTTSSYLDKVKKEAVEGSRPKRIQCCKSGKTLEDVINILADHNIHRVFIVDDQKKPIGIVTLKDILHQLLSP